MSFSQQQHNVTRITLINTSHDKTNAVCTAIVHFALTNHFFTSYIWSVNSPSGVADWLLTTADLRLIFFIYIT